MTSSNDIAEQCGFDSAWEMLKTYMTNQEMIDLLADIIPEDIMLECIEEYAREQHDWYDEEKLRSDAEDAAYDAWKDAQLDRYYGED
jgi:hypothetical protein|tara:strand:+ start:8553 stop:8813 length:261 start_codon:yes stop_codon:yes gene_type:complete